MYNVCNKMTMYYDFTDHRSCLKHSRLSRHTQIYSNTDTRNLFNAIDFPLNVDKRDPVNDHESHASTTWVFDVQELSRCVEKCVQYTRKHRYGRKFVSNLFSDGSMPEAWDEISWETCVSFFFFLFLIFSLCVSVWRLLTRKRL